VIPIPTAKDEILSLVGALSEYECGHLLSAFQNVAAGERFWEIEISAVYNEHVKTRLSDTGRQADDVVSSGPHAGAGIFAPIPIVKSYPGAERVPLPQPGPLNKRLGKLLLQRRSRRDYTGANLDLEQLSTLVHYACGVTGSIPGYGYQQLPLRTFPSSGGLQVPEVYLSVQSVVGIAPGLYHYHLIDNVLESLRPGQHGPLLAALSFQQAYLATASVVFLISGLFERMRWKYGQRAYKYMCMDVGYLGQNLYLVAEAMGLGACAIAGFVDDAMEKLLQIDGRNEMIMFLTTVGVLSEPASA
jgi:SagB-type dehydrogenase family enzyme